MNTSRFQFLLALALCLGMSAAALAVGPTSTLYITNYGEFSGGMQTGLDLVQGASVNSFPTSFPLGIDIAVYGDVRTMGYSTLDKGERFDLNVNSLPGGPYINNIASSQLHDGTSDGAYNYSVNYTTGDVLQFDRNWVYQSTLFNAMTAAGWITMNATDGTFWISQWGGPDVVAHYTSSGTLLGSFNSGVAFSQGLALDPVDGTLWMGDGNDMLYQFSQAGSLLQSASYPLPGLWYGMEFDTRAVPEPSSVILLSLGAVGLLLKSRRLRRTISR